MFCDGFWRFLIYIDDFWLFVMVLPHFILVSQCHLEWTFEDVAVVLKGYDQWLQSCLRCVPVLPSCDPAWFPAVAIMIKFYTFVAALWSRLNTKQWQSRLDFLVLLLPRDLDWMSTVVLAVMVEFCTQFACLLFIIKQAMSAKVKKVAMLRAQSNLLHTPRRFPCRASIMYTWRQYVHFFYSGVSGFGDGAPSSLLTKMFPNM